MKFLRTDEVTAMVGLSRPTIWRLEKAGQFPKRRQLGANSVAWIDEEIDQWMKSRQAVESDRESSGAPPNRQ